MDGPNFAEIQRKHDEGDLTEAEAYKTGQTHAAYGWTAREKDNERWRPELRAAYLKGYNDYKKAHGLP